MFRPPGRSIKHQPTTTGLVVVDRRLTEMDRHRSTEQLASVDLPGMGTRNQVRRGLDVGGIADGLFVVRVVRHRG